MVNYSTIQTELYDLVSGIISDNKSSDLNFNLSDGLPENLVKAVGFPYVLVHTPYRDQADVKLTHGIRRVFFKIDIEVFTRDKESILRELSGLITGWLHSNQATTRTNNIFHFIVANEDLDIYREANKVKIFKNTIQVTYKVTVREP